MPVSTQSQKFANQMNTDVKSALSALKKQRAKAVATLKNIEKRMRLMEKQMQIVKTVSMVANKVSTKSAIDEAAQFISSGIVSNSTKKNIFKQLQKSIPPPILKLLVRMLSEDTALIKKVATKAKQNMTKIKVKKTVKKKKKSTKKKK